ncbi:MULTISPECIES: cupin domain-containing protein [Marinifilum]|uniref:Cupin domain-containing protein n=1 Tax=Marinifilum flexuosum TaxID=1117708 RepID=A0A419XBA4_9BACT|nr:MULTISPECIES: cupin domain-containing protein [Marinifilum]MCY1635533.1 cupin domain-containing protein [Marinifilum sp. D737]RKE04849.1 Cupin domain-containing protein [Marinifilum flexuosum]
MQDIYPEMIKNLPEADIPFNGVRGWVAQGENHQIVFFDIEPIGEVPRHSHGAQWGMMIDGDMDLTIDGETKKYRKGDHYFIPDGVLHSAKFNRRTIVMDYFAESDRYKLK